MSEFRIENSEISLESYEISLKNSELQNLYSGISIIRISG